MDHYQQSQWAGWSYPNANLQYNSYQPYGDYTGYVHDSLDSFQGHNHQQHLVHHQHMSRTTESKPRLSKEEVEVLEAEFQKNHKPNSTVKKALAESMRVDNARINNWFQNRRAREKKENNIRQYEARQRMEKAQNEDVSPRPSSIESRGLTASIAPFPSSRRFARQSSHSASSATGIEDEASEDTRSSAYASPAARVQDSVVSPSQIKLETTETTTAFLCTPSSEDVDSTHSDHTNIRNDVTSGYFPTSTSALSHTTNESHYGSDQDIEALSRSSPDTTSARSASADTDAALISPDSLDIASRRNRRPAPLSIGGARHYLSNGPRTALDTSNKAEFGREMRRVASANGSVRVTKPSAAPRSPFHDRRSEGLFHLNRSPVMTGIKNNMAPPTPDTPIVAGQPNLSQAIVSSGNMMAGAKIHTTGLIGHDPTLRTPPTTPGLGDPLFNLNSGYDISISEQPLATAGLGSFSGGFTLPSLSMAAPNYVASSSSATSQPVTPAYTTTPMGPAYFGYGGGNSEYNWSASTSNGRTSPGQGASFMNVTRSSFQ